MSKYILARKLEVCDKHKQKYCIFKEVNKNCESQIDKCGLPLKLNIFCTAKNIGSNCWRWDIMKNSKDKYIFYRCPSSCKYLIKSRQSILKLYSKKELKEKGIYVGKELSELMNKINVSKEDKNMENVKTIVELFNTYLEIVEGNSPRL